MSPVLSAERSSPARRHLRKASRDVAALGRRAAVEPGRRASPQVLDRIFDNGGAAGRSAPPVRAPPRAQPSSDSSFPKVPRGVKSVSVDIARTPQDVSRLIPKNGNSVNLIALLKRAVRRHPEGLTILTYTDPLGARFVGLDLSRRPAWLDDIPELEPHERDLIRKILARTRDVQVLVREQGKTPDLVVDGVFTELKSVFKGASFTRLVDKANRQVDEFTHRHVLAGGDAAVDLREEDSAPVSDIEEQLNAWAQGVRAVALDRVWVHAGRDVMVFRRVGSRFELYDPSVPGDSGGHARTLGAEELRRAELMLKQGRLRPAQRLLDDVARYGEPSAAAGALRARESLEAARALLKIRKLSLRDGREPAAALWSSFRLSHPPETVAEVSEEVGRLLPSSR